MKETHNAVSKLVRINEETRYEEHQRRQLVQMNSHQQVFLTGPLSKIEELLLWEMCLKLTEQAVVGGAACKDTAWGVGGKPDQKRKRKRKEPWPRGTCYLSLHGLSSPPPVRTHSEAP